MPKKSLHAQAKSALHEIGQADTEDNAENVFERFIAAYQLKYPKATQCLTMQNYQVFW